MKAFVVEDSRLARKELTDLITDHTSLELIGNTGRADDAIEKINILKPDLLFMDINMPGKDGFEVIEALNYSPQIIFVTAYSDYAIKSFDYNTVDYLLKPVSLDRLQKAIAKISSKPSLETDLNDPHAHAEQSDIHSCTSEKEFPQDAPIKNTTVDSHAAENYTDSPISQLDEKSRIFIKDGDQCHLVELGKIIRFESCGNYTQVFFDGKKAFVYRALSKIEERLPSQVFFRASRQHIVNLRCVENIEPWVNGGYQLTLRNGEEIAVSRRHASRLKDILSL